MAKDAKKQNWIVTMRCTVTKQVVCQDCTEEQARNNPWDFASDEMEIGQDDYDVTEVKPND